jgi:hypothetical protein
MPPRSSEVLVTNFLRDALAADAVGVPKLEAMARAAGLLGERQRITDAKPFRRAKRSLRIRSIRDGFGAGGGWLWELPRDPEGRVPTPSLIAPQPTRIEPRVPADWVEGIARVQYHRPPSDVPPHRWRQFVDDCNAFLNSPEAGIPGDRSDMSPSSGHLVESIRALGNRSIGIEVIGHDSVIRGNYVAGTALGGYGIRAVGKGAHVVDNDIHNTNIGIDMESYGSGIAANNRISRASFGISGSGVWGSIGTTSPRR